MTSNGHSALSETALVHGDIYTLLAVCGIYGTCLRCVDCAGVLVDHTDNDLMSAFRFMMQQQNSKQSRLKVADETLMLRMDNSFHVGTASTSAYTYATRPLSPAFISDPAPQLTQDNARRRAVTCGAGHLLDPVGK